MAKPFTKNDPRINRKGRPKKGESLTCFLNWTLDQSKTFTDKKTGEEKKVMLRQILADKLVDLALRGDTQAIKYIYDRIDGKPNSEIKLDGGLQIIKISEDEEKALR